MAIIGVENMKVNITETVLRDGQQSLIATRMKSKDFEPILDKINDAGFYSVECWGGATFDSCLRFLNEDPWDRLRNIKAKLKNTKLQMLLIRPETLKIIALGLMAFAFSTVGGVLLGKLMCIMTGGKINPLIGSAGVSAVPMAARVSQVEGRKANPSNYLLMHAMGPNVAGVIGSAVAAGVLLAMFGK